MKYTINELLSVINKVLLPVYKSNIENISLEDLLNKHKKEGLPALLKNVKNSKRQTPSLHNGKQTKKEKILPS